MKKLLKELAIKFFPYKWQKVVVVIGTGRTGTEFLAKILSNKFGAKLLSYHEPKPDFLEISIQEKMKKLNEDEIVNRIREYRFRYLIKAFFSRRIYFESNNNISFILPYIVKAFPNIKIVFMIRNLDTFLISELNKRHGIRKYLIYSEEDPRRRMSPNLLNEEPGSWSLKPREHKIIWYWSACNQQILRYLGRHDLKHILIRYEDLFGKNRESTFRSMLKFITGKGHVQFDEDFFQKRYNSSKHKDFKGIEDLSSETLKMIESEQKHIENLVSSIYA